MTIRAGTLDRRIELQVFALSADGDPKSGQWRTESTVYADQVEQRQVKQFVSDQTLSEATRAYRIRYRSDVDPTWRVQDGNELWRVRGVGEGEGRRIETILICERFDPQDREFE